MPTKPRHLILLAACLVGLAVLAGIAWRTVAFDNPAPAAVGGPFQLVNQDGKPVDETGLNGKWSVVFFGFTYCPDVCPTTMVEMAQAQERLGPKAKDVQFLFISVDPERDT